MKARHIVLMLLSALGGKIESKTKLYKELYFISLTLNKDLGFKPHYYGPYSPEVELGIDELVGAGFVNMNREVYGQDREKGFEFKKYDFSLTESGEKFVRNLKVNSPKEYDQINDFVRKLQEIGDPDYLSLSLSAKAYYILKQEGEGGMTREQIKEKAKTFKWDVSENDINTAVDILKKLGL